MENRFLLASINVVADAAAPEAQFVRSWLVKEVGWLWVDATLGLPLLNKSIA